LQDVFACDGLGPKLLDRLPWELSGGKRQRADMARAAILKTKVVVCDEPVASLNRYLRKSMLTMLNSFSESDDVTHLIYLNFLCWHLSSGIKKGFLTL